MSAEEPDLERYRTQMERCYRCSLCKWVPITQVKGWRFAQNCPAILKYHFHAYSGGGKVIAALGLLEGKYGITEEFVRVVYRCSLCGACDLACKIVLGERMEPLEILHELRKKFFRDGKIPERHGKLVEDTLKYGNPYAEPRERRGEWARGLGVEGREKPEVLYFAGCTPSYRLPSVARNTVRLLKGAGVSFGILGEEETCCGSPLYKIGAEEAFREQVKKNLEGFDRLGAETLVTQCAGCYHMFKAVYPEVEGMDLEVLHLSEYVERLLEEGRIRFTKEMPLKVTWHDPCHLGRLGERRHRWEGREVKRYGQMILTEPRKKVAYGKEGVYEPPRRILGAIPGVSLLEMQRIREFSFCCAAGGGVRAAYPELARFGARERLEEARATGAEALVTCCPFCELNFLEALEEGGGGMRVMDLTELVLGAMGEESQGLEIRR